MLSLLSVIAIAIAAPAAESPAPRDDTLHIDIEMKTWFGDLDVMQKRRVIRVLVPYSKTLYFVDIGGTQRGISYDLMRAFEEQFNKKRGKSVPATYVAFVPVPRDQLIPMLLGGRGDVVAANLTVTPQRLQQVDFTTPIARGVKELVVTGPGAPSLKSLDDLAGQEVYVRRTTSYYESLVALNQQFARRKLEPMTLREAPSHFETEDVLEMANAGLVRIVVADQYLAHLWRQVYPNIRVHENLALREDGDIAFAIRKNSPKLKSALDDFVSTHRKGTQFGNVTLQRYLVQTRWAKNSVSKAELKKFNAMVELFRKYGDRYDVDWLLMAAQGYQESQLDQSRRSAVGAIGVMQVMPATGKDMAVGDITKIEPNIHAGIKYIRFMIDQYYADEPMDDLNKALFAFASYNAGPNRIRSLRDEARRRGLDPNVWFDNVEYVVSQRIGRETVQYVSNIYKYYIAYTLVRERLQQKPNQTQKPVARQAALPVESRASGGPHHSVRGLLN